MMRKMFSRKNTLPATLIFLGILIFSYPVLAADTYKIGGIFSVTGRASFLGDPEKRSMEMVVEQINAAGGIDGKMLEAVIYDTEGDPTRTLTNVNKLINKDDVIAIVGPSTTPATLAIVNAVQGAQIPLISCAAGVAITTPVKKWVFKTAQSDVLAVATVYDHMKESDVKKIGVLSVANAFGESGKARLVEQASEYGVEIVQAESFGAKDTDMTAQLTKIRKAEPDAIVCWGTNPGPAVVAKNVKQLGIEFPLYQSHGVASPKFIELAGDAAEGILLPTGKILVADLLPEDDPQKKVLTDYIQQYEQKFDMPVSGFGGYAYDAMMMLKEALPGTDGDKAKVRDNLEKIQGLVGVSGVFNFSETEHNGLSRDAFVMVKIENGTWSIVK